MKQYQAPKCGNARCENHTWDESGMCRHHKGSESSTTSASAEKISGAPKLSRPTVQFGDPNGPKINAEEVMKIGDKLREYAKPGSGDQVTRKMLAEVGTQTIKNCETGKPWTYDDLDEWLNWKADQAKHTNGVSGERAEKIITQLKMSVMRGDPRNQQADQYFDQHFPEPSLHSNDFSSDEEYGDYKGGYSYAMWEMKSHYADHLAGGDPVKTDPSISDVIDGDLKRPGWNWSEEDFHDKEKSPSAYNRGWEEASKNGQETSKAAIKLAYKYE